MSEFNLTFYHPYVSDKLERGTLALSTGADQISWGYNLNTQTFPTYGGEVVQILSAYTDDITAQGTIRSYRKMEEIYEWFLAYMQVASQGLDQVRKPLAGQSAYNQQPITMEYPKRGWQFKIQVTQLPGFRYGLDVVAPEWKIVAHVVDDDPAVTSINEAAAIAGIESLHAGIGFNPDDEFSNPFATKSKDFFGKDKEQRDFYDQAADYYASLLPKYLEGDYDSLTGQIGSEPAFMRRGFTKDDGDALDQVRKIEDKKKDKEKGKEK